MAKPSRTHAPGCVFHITARTQGHHPWFTEKLRGRVASEIIDAARSSAMRLIALAIMPNHFHIVLRQGAVPLVHMMHRVMHRSAMLLKHAHKLEGHVFERRYWSGLCATPDYVRRAIVYAHLNPWRAALCTDPAEYQWSTHALYLLASEDRTRIDDGVAVVDGLRFFTRDVDSDDAFKQYIDHVRFQMAVDRFLRGDVPESRIVAPQRCDAGDQHWYEQYASATASAPAALNQRPIFDVAQKILAQIDRDCPLDLVRTNSRARRIVAIRRNVAAALFDHGFRGVQIARFLGISASAVSEIKGIRGR
jgi:REP element-mobilizing transposase RayT